MGEVYRARDTRLNRDVAIKVLPDLFAGDPERLSRFTREAQTLAALNHPHIAQIYGLEESPSTPSASSGQAGSGQAAVRAIVMELVDGEDCRRASHEGQYRSPRRCRSPNRSPTHSKPRTSSASSIAISSRRTSRSGLMAQTKCSTSVWRRRSAQLRSLRRLPYSPSPTLTSPAFTAQGVILGTAAYMSPEQAVGQPVDKRSDLWAFGVVVLEMLTSRRVFTGETVPDVLLDFPFALATGGVQHGLVILVGEVRRKQADPSSCSTGSRT